MASTICLRPGAFRCKSQLSTVQRAFLATITLRNSQDVEVVLDEPPEDSIELPAWVTSSAHRSSGRSSTLSKNFATSKNIQIQTPPLLMSPDTISGARRVRYRKRFSASSNRRQADRRCLATAAGFRGPQGNAGNYSSPPRGEGCDPGASR